MNEHVHCPMSKNCERLYATGVRRVGISAGKNYFLPLAGFNRQKVAKNGKNENDTLAHFTCFLKGLTQLSIRFELR